MALPAGAQDERLTVEVGECVDLATPEERLACFEARVEEARRAAEGRGAAPAEPVVVEARVRPEPRRSSARGSATEVPEPRLSRREQERAERLARPEIVATVAGLRETVPNAYLITLDNGQVWRQTVPMPYRLREGLEVRLYPSGWGDTYRLTNEQLRGYIQVERVR